MKAATPLSVIALALFMNVLWGGNLPAVKLGLQSVPPLWSAFFRFALGASVLAVWALLRGTSLRPARGEWPALFGLSAVFTTQIAAMNFGTSLTAASVAVVLQATNPLFASIFAHYLATDDPLTRRGVIGQAVAFGGVSLVFLSRPQGAEAAWPLLGNLLVLFSGAALGARLALSGRILQRIETTKVVFWQMSLSLPLFAVAALSFERIDPAALRGPPLLAIAYQGLLIAGLGFMVSASLLRRYRASLITSFNFTAPIFGVVWSVLLLGEQPSLWLFAGLATVAAGLFVIATAR